MEVIMMSRKTICCVAAVVVYFIAAWGVSAQEAVRLSISDIPASPQIAVPVEMDNSDVPVAAIQLGLVYDPTVLTLTGVEPAARTEGMSVFQFNIVSPGEFRLIITDFNLNPILKGAGPVVTLTFDVLNSFSDSPISFVTEGTFVTKILDEEGDPLSVTVKNGAVKPDLALPVEALESSETPGTYAISQNSPNPFNLETALAYQVMAPGHVRLRVYVSSGQLVRTLVDGWRRAGSYTILWNGKDERGNYVTSGVYICRMDVNGYSASRKMVVLK